MPEDFKCLKYFVYNDCVYFVPFLKFQRHLPQDKKIHKFDVVHNNSYCVQHSIYHSLPLKSHAPVWSYALFGANMSAGQCNTVGPLTCITCMLVIVCSVAFVILCHLKIMHSFGVMPLFGANMSAGQWNTVGPLRTLS